MPLAHICAPPGRHETTDNRLLHENTVKSPGEISRLKIGEIENIGSNQIGGDWRPDYWRRQIWRGLQNVIPSGCSCAVEREDAIRRRCMGDEWR